jgi:transposase
MGWKGVTVMDQRVRFISEYLNGYFPVNELCDQFSISRKTAYKWIHRYEREGSKGLEDRSHKPHYCPHETDTDIVDAIMEVRSKHLTWGPKKLLEIVGKISMKNYLCFV